MTRVSGFLLSLTLVFATAASATQFNTLIDGGTDYETLSLGFPGDWVKVSETQTHNMLLREYAPRGTTFEDWKSGRQKERISMVLLTPPVGEETPEVTWAEMSMNGYGQAAHLITSSIHPFDHGGRPAAELKMIAEVPGEARDQLGAYPGPLLSLAVIFIRSRKDVYAIQKHRHYGSWEDGISDDDRVAAATDLAADIAFLKERSKICATMLECIAPQ